MVVKANILIDAVLAQKSAWNTAQGHKTKFFIEGSRGGIAFCHRIELQDSETKLTGNLQAVFHQQSAYAPITEIF